ncbi:MAG: hypothetical protein ACTHLK_02490 [Brucella intermedia]
MRVVVEFEVENSIQSTMRYTGSINVANVSNAKTETQNTIALICGHQANNLDTELGAGEITSSAEHFREKMGKPDSTLCWFFRNEGVNEYASISFSDADGETLIPTFVGGGHGWLGFGLSAFGASEDSTGVDASAGHSDIILDQTPTAQDMKAVPDSMGIAGLNNEGKFTPETNFEVRFKRVQRKEESCSVGVTSADQNASITLIFAPKINGKPDATKLDQSDCSVPPDVGKQLCASGRQTVKLEATEREVRAFIGSGAAEMEYVVIRSSLENPTRHAVVGSEIPTGEYSFGMPSKAHNRGRPTEKHGPEYKGTPWGSSEVEKSRYIQTDPIRDDPNIVAHANLQHSINEGRIIKYLFNESGTVAGWVVVWVVEGKGRRNTWVHQQYYGSDGHKIGHELIVNNNTEPLGLPTVEQTSIGIDRYVISWIGRNKANQLGIYQQLFDGATGEKLGKGVLVTRNVHADSIITSFPRYPAGYVTAWTVKKEQGTGWRMLRQAFNIGGHKVFNETTVSARAYDVDS